MEKVLVFGHKSPDTDSICASLVHERLDKRNGWNPGYDFYFVQRRLLIDV